MAIISKLFPVQDLNQVILYEYITNDKWFWILFKWQINVYKYMYYLN